MISRDFKIFQWIFRDFKRFHGIEILRDLKSFQGILMDFKGFKVIEMGLGGFKGIS